MYYRELWQDNELSQSIATENETESEFENLMITEFSDEIDSSFHIIENQQNMDNSNNDALESSTFFEQLKISLSKAELEKFNKFAYKVNIARLKHNITHEGIAALGHAFIEAMAESISPLLMEAIQRFIDSYHLQKKMIRIHDNYVSPVEYSITKNNVKKKFYYIPIIKILNQLLNFELISIILNESASSSSPYVRAQNLFNKLRLVIYGDDFGLANPLGVGKKTQKVFGLYLDIDNWPIYKTKSEDIPALLFVHRETIDFAGSINEILTPLVEDIIKLKVNF